NDIRQTFFQECEELLEALDDGLALLRDALDEGHDEDVETINAVFRSVHSIKGGAAAFGLESLVRFAHRFETTLDDLRAQRLALSADVLEVCLRAADQLAELVAAGRDGKDVAPDAGALVIAKLIHLSGGDSAHAFASLTSERAGDDGDSYTPMPMSFDPLPLEGDDGAEPQRLTFTFTAQSRLFANGHDPVHLFREMSELGDLTVTVDPRTLVDLDVVAPDTCAMTWTVNLTTQEAESAIWEVFEFVEGLCTIDFHDAVPLPLLRPEQAQAYRPLTLDLTSISLIAESATDAVASQDAARASTGKTASGDTAAKPAAVTAKATVRVDLDHVDRLINVVGELVINQAVLTQCIKAANIPMTTALSSSLDEFMALAREIQEGVMAIRAQSVKPLFQRMARIAREAADIAGKTVRFETEGEATEVDKTVIERLVDPLTHIIRNAVDHGLETEEKRRAVGKTDPATVTLRAAHRSGRVLIDVSDNGAGINRSRVLQIAMDKGLVPPDAVLSDQEIDKLLFLPGFSTAATVTDLSGRGVGMDVVRSAIQKLGGRINITSSPGTGTTMSISLPLTLAVLDGMVVDVAGQTMVVPIATIVETIRPEPRDLHKLAGGMTVVAVRERFIPIVDLGHVFQFRAAPSAPRDLVYLLVESDHEQMWALAVDHIHDQRQVVIKGLEGNYGHVTGIAAATILGDGKVALIIDPEEAVQRTDDDLPPPMQPQTEER
ncbi:chemotaxis protein CheA, partial [Loktanella sp. DJP18]|uniref:chemotaxis protein CheA n=1 Tax=Loktanella sp. DJP18 TaxID=3409788 RepID=UPI003BB7E027